MIRQFMADVRVSVFHVHGACPGAAASARRVRAPSSAPPPPPAHADARIVADDRDYTDRTRGRAGHFGVEEPRAEPDRAGSTRRQGLVAARQRHSGGRLDTEPPAPGADEASVGVRALARSRRDRPRGAQREGVGDWRGANAGPL